MWPVAPYGMFVRVGGADVAAIDIRDALRAGVAAGGAGHLAAVAEGCGLISAAHDARYEANVAKARAREAEARAREAEARACAAEARAGHAGVRFAPPAIIRAMEVAQVGVLFTVKVSGKTNVLLVCRPGGMCCVPTKLVGTDDHADVARRLINKLTGSPVSPMEIARYPCHDITLGTDIVRRVYVVEISESCLPKITERIKAKAVEDYGSRHVSVEQVTRRVTKRTVITVGGGGCPISDHTGEALKKCVGW